VTGPYDHWEKDLKAAICSLTSVTRTNQGFEITLPQAYHSGHAVAVVACKDGDGFLVHDNSYAALLLANVGVRTDSALNAAISGGVESYGCHLEGMRVWRKCATEADIGFAAVLVGCASRLIADYALKAKPQPVFDFKSHLIGKVVASVGERRVRTNEEVRGQHGSRYRVSTVVLDRSEARPIAFVEPVADREAVARRFKEFYDIKMNPAYEAVSRIAVYDDSHPLATGDALLLQDVGNLVRFTDATTRFGQLQ
jgi:hypothetical protein